jgi:hypothetical protein
VPFVIIPFPFRTSVYVNCILIFSIVSVETKDIPDSWFSNFDLLTYRDYSCIVLNQSWSSDIDCESTIGKRA